MNHPMELPPIPAARVSPDSLRAGSPLEVPDGLRSRLCLLDNGTLYIANAHRGDEAVLEYTDILRRQRSGLGYNVEYVTPDIIQELYRNIRPAGGADVDSARQKQMMEIIRDAVQEGASDIHIINTSASSGVEFRIDGILYKYRGRGGGESEHRVTGSDGQALCGALLQGMAHTGGGGNYDMNSPQDSRLKPDVAALCGLQGARIATRPAQSVGGNLVVMRLLYDRAIQSFGSLGFEQEQIEMLREYIYRRKGMFLISGPTGGGKTTTLYAVGDAILKEENYGIRLMTVEDPIESKLPGGVQTQLSYNHADGTDAIGKAWFGAIRNGVRLDPDVLFVGEIRDRESAIAAIHFAMTGHGLLGTIHTENATQTLDRLKEMGVDKSLLADPTIMRCLGNQSLAPKNCPSCRQPYLKVRARVPRDVRDRIEKYCPDPSLVFLHGRDRGCPNCKGRGIKGRIAISEIIRTNAELLKVWADHGAAQMRATWVKSGGLPKSHALARAVSRGLVDPVLGEKEIGCLMSDDR